MKTLRVAASTPGRQLAQVTTPEAIHLASLHSITVDLDFVIKYTDRLITADRDERGIPRDALAFQAFWAAALVAYARCFDRGHQREGLSEGDVIALALEAWHRTFMNLRDQHIAHPLDVRAEEYTVDVTLMLPESGVRQVTGVVVSGHKEAGPSSEQIRELGRTGNTLRKLVGDRLKVAQNAVVAQARARPIDELYATPASEIVLVEAPGPDPAPSKRRRKRKQ